MYLGTGHYVHNMANTGLCIRHSGSKKHEIVMDYRTRVGPKTLVVVVMKLFCRYVQNILPVFQEYLFNAYFLLGVGSIVSGFKQQRTAGIQQQEKSGK